MDRNWSGRPAGEYQPPPPTYPPQYYYPPPPPKKDYTLLIVVVVTIVVITLFVILYVLMFALMSSMMDGFGWEDQTGNEPDVMFGQPEEVSPGVWRVVVEGANRNEALENYQVIVLNESEVEISAHNLVQCKTDSLCVGDGLSLEFVDQGSDGRLNAGDFFVLSGTDSESDYTIVLLWGPTGGHVAEAYIVQ